MWKASKTNEAAKVARLALIQDSKHGEKLFDELLKVEPRDGFIYFERAKAYESIGNTAQAHDDYLKAKQLFPMRRWKDIAEEGVQRTLKKFWAQAPADKPINLDVLRIPKDLENIWNETMLRLNADPLSGCAQARTLLEKIVDTLLREKKVDLRSSSPLVEKIEILKSDFPSSVIASMQHIRILGNEAVHGGQITSDHANEVISSFHTLVMFAYPNSSKT